MKEVWIIDAVRTPRSVAKPGKGKLTGIHPHGLLATALSALQARNGFDTADVDDVIAGCGAQRGRQGYDIARMAALDAGWHADATGISVDRYCGSGLSAVNFAAMGILSGQQDLVVAGGVEKMSDYGEMQFPALTDSGNTHLRELHPTPHQGICADLIASLHGFTRAQADELAAESQRRAGVAMEQGYFAKSLVPVTDEAGAVLLDREDYPRPGTTVETLGSLAPAFVKLYDLPLDEQQTSCRSLVERRYPDVKLEHIHHAGNSSGVVDGAAAVLLASPAYAKAHGLKPRARVRAVANGGCDPVLMLDAPPHAARRCLKKAGMAAGDIDLWEINEAFAVVPLRFMRELDLDPVTVNVNGGAIALGHPIGATGAMILGTLLDELERRDLSTGLVTMCTGGGMAPAMIIERV